MSNNNNNTRGNSRDGWGKVLAPVIIPMITGACVFLGAAAWKQTVQITELQSRIASQTVVITQYDTRQTTFASDVQTLRLDFTRLESKLQNTTASTDKIIDILDDLGDTLERINISVGKLETRLDFAEKNGG